jgi:RHS repeat-associated protein
MLTLTDPSGFYGYTATYNVDNRMSSVVTTYAGVPTTSRFVYDGDGGRVKKIDGTTTTRYISKLYECDTTGGNTTCSRYIWGNDTRVASVATNGTVHYWHGDHLGSSSVITDSTGAKVQALTYYPYGDVRTNVPGTPVNVPYKFTGKELDFSSNLYFYEARYYHAVFGRFISPDTLVPNPSDPQDLNRYTYAGNNPLKYTDPSGHFKIGKFFKRLFHPGGLNRFVQNNLAARVLGWAFLGPGMMSFIDPVSRPYAIAAGAMAATVATGGAAAPTLGPILGGALGGAIGGAIGGAGSALSGQRVDWASVMLAGTIGGGLGGASGLIGDPFLNMIARGVTGGVTSSLRGGDFKMGFAIGFGTAAAFHAYTAVTGFSGIQPGPGGDVLRKTFLTPSATQGMNNVGFGNGTDDAIRAAQGSFCCNEGSWLMNAAGTIPGVNAMAGFHDFLTDPNHLGMSLFTNYPTMLPSYALTIAGGINQLTIDGNTFSLTAPLLQQMRIR